MSQNPSSMNLGTTVWDASIVLAKFLEKVTSIATLKGNNMKGLVAPVLIAQVCGDLNGRCVDVAIQNARKGEFSRANVKGKRAIELGAGPGLGGMAMALLGADVLLTDLADIVPLIQKNVDANFTLASLHGAVLPCMHRSSQYKEGSKSSRNNTAQVCMEQRQCSSG